MTLTLRSIRTGSSVQLLCCWCGPAARCRPVCGLMSASWLVAADIWMFTRKERNKQTKTLWVSDCSVPSASTSMDLWWYFICTNTLKRWIISSNMLLITSSDVQITLCTNTNQGTTNTAWICVRYVSYMHQVHTVYQVLCTSSPPSLPHLPSAFPLYWSVSLTKNRDEKRFCDILSGEKEGGMMGNDVVCLNFPLKEE